MDFTMQVRSAVLAAGEGAFASHRSAARLWNFGVDFRDKLEMTVPRGRLVVIPGLTVHTSNVPDVFLTQIDGIQVTNAERTLLELSSFRSDATVKRILDDAVIRRIVDLDRLLLTYRLLRSMGRRRFGVWRRVLPSVFPEMAKLDTAAEVRAFEAWRDAGLELPQPQYRLMVDGRTRYLDFAYPNLKIAVEIDGFVTHDRLRAAADRRSDRWMETRGWIVLRFANSSSDAEFVNDVRAAIVLKSTAA